MKTNRFINIYWLTCLQGKQSFDWPYNQHANHHNWKYGDGISSHIHDKQIHRYLKSTKYLLRNHASISNNFNAVLLYLFERSQGQIPRFFYDEPVWFAVFGEFSTILTCQLTVARRTHGVCWFFVFASKNRTTSFRRQAVDTYTILGRKNKKTGWGLRTSKRHVSRPYDF